MMIDGIPHRPLYFYQKDIIGYNMLFHSHILLNNNVMIYGYVICYNNSIKIIWVCGIIWV